MEAPGKSRSSKNRKVLLMGKSGAGKSSMRSIVFSNYVAKDVRRLGATMNVEHSNIRFMGNLMLNLWDCGGQDGFMESFLTSADDTRYSGGLGSGAGSGSGSGGGGQREHVFTNVAVLIYVFDVESRTFAADAVAYGNIIRALAQYSQQAQLFVLIHKMDLVQTHLRTRLFNERTEYIRKQTELPFKDTVTFFPTSIWDQSLYRAWTSVITTLIPNATQLDTLLRSLAHALDARELILFERTTCLTVCSVARGDEAPHAAPLPSISSSTSLSSKPHATPPAAVGGNPYHDRFERLASILKTHRHSLARHARVPASAAHFALLELKTSRFMLFVVRMTENTNLCAVMGPSEQSFNNARINVEMARQRFVDLDLGREPGGKVKGKRKDQETWLEEAARDMLVSAEGQR